MIGLITTLNKKMMPETKNTKLIFWMLNIIGALAVFSAIFAYTKGADFNTYFWGGLCGIVLIGMANRKRE